MLYISLDDQIMRKGKCDKVSQNTKIVTNVVLYSGLVTLIGTGVISTTVVINCVIFIGINKVAKIAIKKSNVVNKIRGLYIKDDLVELSN